MYLKTIKPTYSGLDTVDKISTLISYLIYSASGFGFMFSTLSILKIFLYEGGYIADENT